MTIYVLSKDLMDKSRFPSSVSFIKPEQISDAVPDDTVVIDLDAFDDVDLSGLAARTIGYCSHVNFGTIETKCVDSVFTRSQFFSDISLALS